VRGLDIPKFMKTPLIYSVVFHISDWGIGAFYEGLNPTKVFLCDGSG